MTTDSVSESSELSSGIKHSLYHFLDGLLWSWFIDIAIRACKACKLWLNCDKAFSHIEIMGLIDLVFCFVCFMIKYFQLFII
jgi:hypothetical protein